MGLACWCQVDRFAWITEGFISGAPAVNFQWSRKHWLLADADRLHLGGSDRYFIGTARKQHCKTVYAKVSYVQFLHNRSPG